MVIPFLDLVAVHAEIRSSLDDAVARVMDSGRFVLGKEVAAFEEEFAAFCGTRYCVAVGNGLDALHLALRAAGIGPGDEVIVPAQTFVATWLAVTHAGARPVGVDVLDANGNIAPSLIAEAVSGRTRAILAVDLYGNPADYAEIRPIALQHGLVVIEDAAQAHGASYAGRRAGSLGDVGAFSFYPGKNLGAIGDGGAVTTDDVDIADEVRRLRNYGGIEKHEHVKPGFNSRLDELQAAVLRVKLRSLTAWNERRQAVAEIYLETLAKVEVELIEIGPVAESAWHLFPIRHERRYDLAVLLHHRGVQTGIHYPSAVHQTGAYAASVRARYPVAEAFAARELSLPMGPHMTPEMAHRVVEAVLGAVQEL